jgi:hypothetical protein
MPNAYSEPRQQWQQNNAVLTERSIGVERHRPNSLLVI